MAPLNSTDTIAPANATGIVTVNPGGSITNAVQYYRIGSTGQVYQNSNYKAPSSDNNNGMGISGSSTPNSSVPSTTQPIVNANAASTDYTNKLANTNNINNTIATQAANNSANNTTITPEDGDNLNEITQLLADNPNADPYTLGLTDNPPTNATQSYDNTPAPNGYRYMYDAQGNRVSVVDNPTQASIASQQQDIQTQQDQAYETLQTQIQQFSNGTFPLTPTQQAQINAVQAQFDQLKSAQETANANYQGGVTNANAASGRARYAPEIALGEVQNAITVGLQKVADIEAKATDAVQKLTQGFLTQNYDMVNNTYKDLSNYLSAKDKALSDMSKNITTATKAALDEFNKKVTQDQAQQKINNSVQQKALDFAQKHNIQTPFFMIAGTAYDSKTGEPLDYNTYIQRGGDPNFGSNSITQVETKGDTYQINAKVNGHTYRETFDATGKLINREDLGFSSTGNGSGSHTAADIKQASNLIDQAFDTVKGTDKYISPEAWNTSLNKWIKDGYGTVQQFVNAHKKWTNPADPKDYQGLV